MLVFKSSFTYPNKHMSSGERLTTPRPLISEELTNIVSKTESKRANNLEDENQGHPLSRGVESNTRCLFGVNLVQFS